MTKRKVLSIVALVIIFDITIVVSQFITNMVFRYAFCAFGGVLASTVQRQIAKR